MYQNRKVGGNQITEKASYKHSKLREKPKEEKTTEREREASLCQWRLQYSSLDSGEPEVLFLLEGILYLYKLCQIDELRSPA